MLMLVALVVAIVMAYRLWSEIKEDDEPASPLDLLSEFEEARAAGELDDEEFQRVRASLRKPGIEGAMEAARGKPPASPEGPAQPPADEGRLPDSPSA